MKAKIKVTKKARKAFKKMQKSIEKEIVEKVCQIAEDAQRGIFREIGPCPIKFTDMTCEEFAREERTLDWWPDDIQ